MKVILSLHDQVTELQYPESFQRYVELLFGRQTCHCDRPPGRVISIREVGPKRYSIRTDPKPLISDLGVAEVLDALLEDVVHSLIDGLDSAVALHAASVAWHGKSILLPGPTGVGKTSLAGWFIAMHLNSCQTSWSS